MSSIAKAALISAAVFAVILTAFLFLVNRDGRVPQAPPIQVAEVAEPVDIDLEPEAEVKESGPLTPLVRDAVKLTVEVIEKGTRRNLARSRLMVFKSDGERPGQKVWESVRASTGTFDVPLDPGLYLVHAQCPRYRGERRAVTLLKDAPQSLVIELDRGDSISGRILTSRGTPIGGARVLALQDLAAPGADIEEVLIRMIEIQEMTGRIDAETVSAEDGTYQLDGLEPRYYTVRAVAQSYAPGEVAEAPAPRQEVDVVLQKGGIVSGIVKDTAGMPVVGASIKAYRDVDSADVFQIIMAKARPAVDAATSGQGGVFEFRTLGTGTFSFLVEAKGYQRAQETKRKIIPGDTNILNFTLKPGQKIIGIVRGPNDEPVSGARVRANVTGAAANRRDQVNISFDDESVVTDDQGNFSFDTLEDGTFMLLCWHPDYQTVRRQDVRPSSEEIVLKMGHGGRIRGLVVDAATGEPIAGARATVNDVADINKDAVSQEDGAFLLTGLGGAGSRPVHVNVNADGYGRVRKEIRVEAGREIEETFELQPTGSMSGVVVNSNNDPVRGARVTARKSQSGVEQNLSSDISDEDGRFVLNGIDAGENVWVRVKKAEYLEGMSATFSVEAGQAIEVPPVVLGLGGSVGGRVLGTDGNGLPGSTVTVSREGDTEIKLQGNPSSTTNARGEFIIQGLPSETISLVVKANRFLEKTVTGVEVREGQIRSDIVVQLETGNSLSGRVVDGMGQPVGGAEVVARDYAQGAKELRSSSGDDGRFHVDGIVANDSVELEVTHDSYSSFSQERVPVNGPEVDVVLRELAKLRGTVIDSEGREVQSFSVLAQASGETKDPRRRLKAETFNTKDGKFEYAGVPAGVYSVSVRAPSYAAETVPDVQVAEGEVVDLGDIVLDAGGMITGKVFDGGTQRPIEGARVQIVQGASRFVKNDPSGIIGGGAPRTTNPIQTTGPDGSFLFSGLKSGTLSLRVSHDSFVTQKIDGVNPDDARTARDLTVMLDRGGSISGALVDKAGQPRTAMAVYLIGSSADSNQTKKSDAQGRFHFESIPPGAFTVKAHSFGGAGRKAEMGEVAVEMTPGGAFEVVIEVE